MEMKINKRTSIPSIMKRYDDQFRYLKSDTAIVSVHGTKTAITKLLSKVDGYVASTEIKEDTFRRKPEYEIVSEKMIKYNFYIDQYNKDDNTFHIGVVGVADTNNSDL